MPLSAANFRPPRGGRTSSTAALLFGVLILAAGSVLFYHFVGIDTVIRGGVGVHPHQPQHGGSPVRSSNNGGTNNKDNDGLPTKIQDSDPTGSSTTAAPRSGTAGEKAEWPEHSPWAWVADALGNDINVPPESSVSSAPSWREDGAKKGYRIRYDRKTCTGAIWITGYGSGSAGGKNRQKNKAPMLSGVSEDDSYLKAVDSLFGPEWFEALLIGPSLQHVFFRRHSSSGGSGDAYVGQFRIRRTTGNEEEEVGYTVLVRHLFTEYNAVRERLEEADLRYHEPSIVPWLGRSIRTGSDTDTGGRGAEEGSNTTRHHQEEQVVGTVQLENKAYPPLQQMAFKCDLPFTTEGSGEGEGGGSGNSNNSRAPMWVRYIPNANNKKKETNRQKPLVWSNSFSFVDHRKGEYSGYWLPLSKKLRYDYDKFPNYNADLLGRMNIWSYHREWQTVHPQTLLRKMAVKTTKKKRDGGDFPPPVLTSPFLPVECDRLCILNILQDRTIYFVGDSHMRIFFYGFLTRLEISYPMNKVWRGDRTDYIKSHNVTVKFVASYFLNLTRPTALEMLADRGRPVVVAGVGQHHSCHCYALKKHLSIVRESVDTLLERTHSNTDRTGGSGALQQGGGEQLSTKSAAPPRQLVWFGVPAQPYNRHLHAAKPIGQSRKDCRNNARHLIYEAHQRRLMNDYRVPMVETFGLSVPLAHTSLDGAHYYTEVRAQWIDQLMWHIKADRASDGKR